MLSYLLGYEPTDTGKIQYIVFVFIIVANVIFYIFSMRLCVCLLKTALSYT